MPKLATSSTTKSGEQKKMNKNQDTTIMKVKYIQVALLALAFYGCDESTGSLGLGMFPESDRNMNGRDTTFHVVTKSILSDSVYAKTNVGYVGKFTDRENLFGSYECSFLAQLYCPEGITFPTVYDPETNPKGTMAGDSTYTAELVLYYKSYFGDSLSACRMSIYELNRNLEQKYYTDINPSEYYSQNNGLLARKAYTAVDLSLSDSIRNSSDFYPNVRFTSPKLKELGEKILKANREHPEWFAKPNAFIDNLFKGIYAKSDYGDGTILYVDQINLNIVFLCHNTDSLGNIVHKKDGTDSLYYTTRTFATTREVIQSNQIKNNSKELEERVKEENHSFLKTPAGIFTQAELPFDAIAEKLSNDSLSAVKLTFTNYNQEIKDMFSMKAPSHILMVRKKEMHTFFEENKLADNITSYIATQNSFGVNQYVFPNLTRLVNTCLNEKAEAKKKAGANWTAEEEKKWEEENDWNKVVVIPVTIQYDNSSNNNLISIQHDLQPSYVKLVGGNPEKGGSLLDLQVTYVNFTGKN